MFKGTNFAKNYPFLLIEPLHNFLFLIVSSELMSQKLSTILLERFKKFFVSIVSFKLLFKGTNVFLFRYTKYQLNF